MMVERDNPAEHTALRVGLIVDEQGGVDLVRAVEANPRLELTALAGAAIELPEDVAWFDDRRVMITHSQLDAVLLADSTRAAVDLHDMTRDYDLAVWRRPPLARNFAEAVQLAKTLVERPHAFRMQSWWEHIREPVRAALHQVEDFKPRFTEILVAAPGPSIHSWRSGTVDAGGGVATLDAYDLLEALLATCGLPDNVSAATGRFRRHAGEAARETEDVALALLRYEGGGVVNLRASWDIRPHTQCLIHHGAEASLKLTRDAVTLYDSAGETIHEAALPSDLLDAELRCLVNEIDAPPSEDVVARRIDRHVALNALLESLYLSARTWHPETPRKLYEAQGWRELRS